MVPVWLVARDPGGSTAAPDGSFCGRTYQVLGIDASRILGNFLFRINVV